MAMLLQEAVISVAGGTVLGILYNQVHQLVDDARFSHFMIFLKQFCWLFGLLILLSVLSVD